MSRRWSIFAVALAAALSFAAIGDATAAPDPVGSWYSDACIVQIELRADGTFLHEDGAVTLDGTWRLNGATLTLTYSDGTQESGTFTDGGLDLAACVFKRV
jgi:hypothetical protein